MQKREWNSWKLNTNKGRQWWTYLGEQSDFAKQAKAFVYNKKENPNSGDRVYRAQKADSLVELLPSQIPFPDNLKDNLSRKAFQAAYTGIHFYKSLQTERKGTGRAIMAGRCSCFRVWLLLLMLPKLLFLLHIRL